MNKGLKYALVTGGSRGIGRAVSIKLAQMGYYVLINYISNLKEAELTLSMVRDCGSDGELIKFDASKRDQVIAAIDSWNNLHPDTYIQVLVNNAGLRKDNLMMWMEAQEWDAVIDVSLNGFFNVTKAVLKNMLVNKYGRIINISSLSGIKGLPGQTNYAAAKGGIIAATKALAQEVAKKNVTVNAVAPGFIKTDMTAELDEGSLKKLIPTGRFGEPREVAELVGFLAGEGSAYITGEVISINGGLYT